MRRKTNLSKARVNLTFSLPLALTSRISPGARHSSWRKGLSEPESALGDLSPGGPQPWFPLGSEVQGWVCVHVCAHALVQALQTHAVCAHVLVQVLQTHAWSSLAA